MARILVIGARGIPNVEGGAEKNAELAVPSFRPPNTDKPFHHIAAIGHAVRLLPQVVHLQGPGAALFVWVYKLLRFRTVVRYGSADYLSPSNFVGQNDVGSSVAGFCAAVARPESFVVGRSGFLGWDDIAVRTGEVYRAAL